MSSLVPTTAWLLGATFTGILVQRLLYVVLIAASRRTGSPGDEGAETPSTTIPQVLERTRRPAAIVSPALLLLLSLRVASLAPDLEALARHALAIVLIAAASWLVVCGVDALAAATLSRYDVTARDNLAARKVHTQLRVITRILTIVVWTLGVAAMLMTFPSIRQLGTSLLASAGLAGLILGLAAQRTIGNFLAGIQIAITQPIRLDDAVVIGGEWGWIEEITATYVVVKVWDERRLVVPFNTLLDQPFQNWTRTTAHLLGSVTLWTDYTVPVQAVRDELRRVLDRTDLWDGRVGVLQVVDTTDRALQLRALVSAADSPGAWDLRCHVREKLVEFLQREHPTSLPRLRAVVEDPTDEPTRHAASPDSQPDTGGLPGAPEGVVEERPT